MSFWPSGSEIASTWRSLAKARSFSVVTLLSLSLGIGANVAIFSLLREALWKPLPYPEDERIVVVWSTDRKEGVDALRVAPLDFLDWREQNRVFEHLGALMPWGFNLTGEGEPESLQAAAVSPGLFVALGCSPLLGRSFLAEEETPGRDDVILLSHGFWERRFGADHRILGRRLVLDGRPHTVAGVMPAGFAFPSPEIAVWTPLTLDREQVGRRRHQLQVFGRLKAGVSLPRAQRSFATLASALERAFPETNAGRGVRLVTLRDQLYGPLRLPLILLQCAVVVVLATAFANVLNLTLARALQQAPEQSLRSALGASSLALVRHALLESLTLGLIGGCCGVWLALAVLRLFRRLAPEDLFALQRAEVDWQVLALALSLSLLVGTLLGILPALRHLRADPLLAFRGSSSQRTPERWRRWGGEALVTLEMALATVLLVSTLLIGLQLLLAERTSPGFSTRDRLFLQLSLPEARYPSAVQRWQFFEGLLSRLRQLPPVASAGAVNVLPMTAAAGDPALPFAIVGRPRSAADSELLAPARTVTEDYFSTLGIPLVRGRAFQSQDHWDSPRVALINEALMKRFWPAGNPLGERLRLFVVPAGIEHSIVGVVGNVRHEALDREPTPEIYLPFAQNPLRSMNLVMKITEPADRVLAAVKTTLWSLDPAQPIFKSSTLDRLVGESLGRRRFFVTMTGLFAAVALCLTLAGLYGVLSRWLAQRSQELAIRLALGASRRDLRRQVVGRGLTLVARGLVLGLLGVAWMSPLLARLTGEESSLSSLVLVSGLATIPLWLVALLASLLPARKITRIEPMFLFRCEVPPS